MPIKPRFSTARTEIQIMRPRLVISLTRPPPSTLLALPQIVPRSTYSTIILTFPRWLNGKKEVNMNNCHRDMSRTQLHEGSYSTVKR
jgi:hypothetical protein